MNADYIIGSNLYRIQINIPVRVFNYSCIILGKLTSLGN